MLSGDVTEITEVVESHIVGDRLHFTLVSGKRTTTYSISFFLCQKSCRAPLRLLEQHEREQTDRVRAFKGVKVAEAGH